MAAGQEAFAAGRARFKAAIAVENELVRELLSEFLGTFVLVVSVKSLANPGTRLGIVRGLPHTRPSLVLDIA